MMPLLDNAGGLLFGLLLTILVILASTYRPPRHRRTDPACRFHQPPRTPWTRWRYNQRRGRPCSACMRRRRYEWGGCVVDEGRGHR